MQEGSEERNGHVKQDNAEGEELDMRVSVCAFGIVSVNEPILLAELAEDVKLVFRIFLKSSRFKRL